MQTVTTEALTLEANIISAEASTCGFKPGEWPEQFETTTPAGWTCTYRRTRARTTPDGELLAMVYTTLQGEPDIHILND